MLQTFESERTDAHRLCTTPDGWVERFGRDVLVSYKSEAACERLSTEFFLWAQTANFTPARVIGRFLPIKNAEREHPKLLFGDDGSDWRGVAIERHLRYGIDFSAGYSVGLFVDQRENRRFVREVDTKRMLNCFAYTCAFSVAGAASGAETLSIDLSRKSLERGRENFALNALSATGHRFMADDVFDVLPRLARKGELFDMIILDPPTFSRSRRGKTFQVESDFERLLLLALEVADRDCRLLLSTNCTSLDGRALEVMARFSLKGSRRAGKLHREPAPAEFPPGSAASTIWLTLR